MTVRSFSQIAVAPGAGDKRRLVGMAAGVAVGVMLAALLWAGFTGLGDRSERSTWMEWLDHAYGVNEQWTPGTTLTSDEVAARGTTDIYDSQSISVLYVFETENSTVGIPGTRSPIRPGTAWVSPALAQLIESAPADQLGDRFGTVRGTLPDRVLAGPDSLVAVVGVAEAAVDARFAVVSDFAGHRFTGPVYETLAGVGAVAVLMPVAMLIGVVISFGSVERSARMRALHLMGATAQDRAKFAAVESGGVALIGSVAGLVLAWVAAIPVANVRVLDSRFYPQDLRVSVGEGIVIVLIVVVAFGAYAAFNAARFQSESSAVRDRAEPPLRWWRLAPMVTGLLLLLQQLFTPFFSSGLLLIAAFVLVAVGIVALGPIATRAVARFFQRRSHSAAGVMAYGRIVRYPRQIFRAVSGVVIAVFLVSLFMSGISSVREGQLSYGEGHLADDVLMVTLSDPYNRASAPAPALIEALVERIDKDPGVTGLVRIHADDSGTASAAAEELRTVGIEADYKNLLVRTMPVDGSVVLGIDEREAHSDPITDLFIATADADARERVRTILADVLGVGDAAVTRSEYEALGLTAAREYRSLAILGILVAAGVSAIALAAATIAAVRDRRRTLGLMRLTGMPFSTVRSMMIREAAVPLFAALALSAVVGYGVGLFLITLLSNGARSVTAPPLEYYLVIGATLALSVIAVAAAFPAARRATSGDATRFE